MIQYDLNYDYSTYMDNTDITVISLSMIVYYYIDSISFRSNIRTMDSTKYLYLAKKKIHAFKICNFSCN